MQDRFIADVGDFGKYGLLRRICGGDGRFPEHRSLAVLWYRTLNGEIDETNARPEYLDDIPAYRDCDPLLFETMGEIVASGRRKTNSVEIAEILGDVAFHSDAWSFDGMTSQQMRDVERKRLFLGAMRTVGAQQVIFVDADDGLMRDGIVPNAGDATRWIGWDEMVKLAALRRTLVIRQPANELPIRRQGVRRAVELIEKLRLDVRPIPLVFQRGAACFFFVIPAPDDVESIQERCLSMVAGDDPWSRHFDILSRVSGP